MYSHTCFKNIIAQKWDSRKMTVKLFTINNIERDVINLENKQLLLLQFYEFMKISDTLEKYKNNNLKELIAYNNFLLDNRIEN